MLEEKAAKLRLGERVIFAGMVPPNEVARYYSLGDIFVSASQSEDTRFDLCGSHGSRAASVVSG